MYGFQWHKYSATGSECTPDVTSRSITLAACSIHIPHLILKLSIANCFLLQKKIIEKQLAVYTSNFKTGFWTMENPVVVTFVSIHSNECFPMNSVCIYNYCDFC